MPPQLRLFAGDGQAEPPPPIWTQNATLSQVFRAHYLPIALATVDPKTVSAYEQALAHWTVLAGDPPAADFAPPRGQAVLARFVQQLRERRGKQLGSKLSPATVAKQLRHLSPLLECLGPPSRSNPNGLGILPAAPFFSPSSLRVPRMDTLPPFTVPEISKLLDHADAADKPRLPGLGAKDWWRALILTAYNTAWRIETLLGLRYSWITGEWALVPEEFYKGGGRRAMPFPAAARQAIEIIRTPRELVFPYAIDLAGQGAGNKRRDGCCRRHLDDLFRRIKAAAGLAPDDGRTFHALRRAAAVELARINPAAATFTLGHAGQQVTKQHYTGNLPALDWLAKLPQP